MDTQIDHIALRDILLPLGKKILGELEEKIKTKKRSNWFEIFLATFIIMNNFEFIFADIVEYTKRHGIKVRLFSTLARTQQYRLGCELPGLPTCLLAMPWTLRNFAGSHLTH